MLKGHITDFLLILYKKRPKNEQEGTKNEWKLTKKKHWKWKLVLKKEKKIRQLGYVRLN